MDIYTDTLKSSGLRPTKHRIEILKLLFACGRPISHKELWDMCSKSDLDRVTVYRTLDALAASGAVHKIQGSDAVNRYCAHRKTSDTCPADHSHFLCVRCGTMICLENSPMPRVEVPPSYVVNSKQLLLEGLCAACAAQSGE